MRGEVRLNVGSAEPFRGAKESERVRVRCKHRTS